MTDVEKTDVRAFLIGLKGISNTLVGEAILICLYVHRKYGMKEGPLKDQHRGKMLRKIQ